MGYRENVSTYFYVLWAANQKRLHHIQTFASFQVPICRIFRQRWSSNLSRKLTGQFIRSRPFTWCLLLLFLSRVPIWCIWYRSDSRLTCKTQPSGFRNLEKRCKQQTTVYEHGQSWPPPGHYLEVPIQKRSMLHKYRNIYTIRLNQTVRVNRRQREFTFFVNYFLSIPNPNVVVKLSWASSPTCARSCHFTNETSNVETIKETEIEKERWKRKEIQTHRVEEHVLI